MTYEKSVQIKRMKNILKVFWKINDSTIWDLLISTGNSNNNILKQFIKIQINLLLKNIDILSNSKK